MRSRVRHRPDAGQTLVRHRLEAGRSPWRLRQAGLRLQASGRRAACEWQARGRRGAVTAGCALPVCRRSAGIRALPRGCRGLRRGMCGVPGRPAGAFRNDRACPGEREAALSPALRARHARHARHAWRRDVYLRGVSVYCRRQVPGLSPGVRTSLKFLSTGFSSSSLALITPDSTKPLPLGSTFSSTGSSK